MYAGAPWAEAYWREFAASAKMRWEPYTYWRRQPFHGRYINVGAAGLRASWTPPDTAQALTLWFFGGSTLWGTGARDAHTIPSEVARQLTARLGRPVRAVNFGESGYVSGQEVVALQRALVAGERPDAVVFYDGVNDTFSAFQSGTAGLPSNEANRVEEFSFFRDAGAGAYFARGLHALAFNAGLGQIAFALTARRREAARARQQAARYPPARLDALAAATVRVYGAQLALARALAAADSFAVYAYWQPSAFTKAILTPYERATLDPDRYVAPLLARTTAHLRASSLVRSGLVRDLSALFDTTRAPRYLDFCHLGEAGNAEVAAAIATDLAPRLAAPILPERTGRSARPEPAAL